MYIRRFSKNTKGRDFVVGDIHGYFSALEYKLTEVDFDETRDRLFSVGDLVDRGPESERVVEFLRKPWFFAVQGNHDVMTYEQASYHISNGGMWYYDLLEPEKQDIAFELAALPLAIEVETDDGLVGIVHAQVPFRDWELFRDKVNSGTDAVMVEDAQWGRSIIARYKQVGDDGSVWVSGIDKVYVGHTIVSEPLTIGNIRYIDTSAYKKGGALTIERIQ